jgi:hypothetical protein
VQLEDLYKHRDKEAAKLGISMKSKKSETDVHKRPAAATRDRTADDDDDDDAPLVLQPPMKRVRARPAAHKAASHSESSESDVSSESGVEVGDVVGIGLGDPPSLGFFEEAQLLA